MDSYASHFDQRCPLKRVLSVFTISLALCTGCAIEQGQSGLDSDEGGDTSSMAGVDIISDGGTVSEEAGSMTTGPSCEELSCGACEDGSAPIQTDEGCCQCPPSEPCRLDIQCASGQSCINSQCREIQLPACECNEIFNPVCGEDDVTYENECLADCLNVEIVSERPCEDILLPERLCFEGESEPECSVLCETATICVGNGCGFDGELSEVFSSECVESCSEDPNQFLGWGWTILCEETSSCDEFFVSFLENINETICEDSPSRECDVLNPDVNYVGFGDTCRVFEYDCLPNQEYYVDECGCGCIESRCECPDSWDEPVCDMQGQRYANRCEANCNGQYDVFECEQMCECPHDDYAPHCGLDGITYQNACLLECSGTPLLYEGACGTQGRDGFCGDTNPNEPIDCNEVCATLSECYQSVCSEELIDYFDQECAVVCEEDFEGFAHIFCGFSTCEQLTSGFGPLFLEDDRCEIELLDCPVPEREANYFSYDSDTCSLIETYDCQGGESFNNLCGCGCVYRTCPEESERARYINYDVEVCSQFTLTCPDGSQLFNDECGCGCVY